MCGRAAATAICQGHHSLQPCVPMPHCAPAVHPAADVAVLPLVFLAIYSSMTLPAVPFVQL